jgi:hypothetical protein
MNKLSEPRQIKPPYTDICKIAYTMKKKDTVTNGISLPRKLVEKIEQDRGDISRGRFLIRIIEDYYSTKKEGNDQQA